MPIWSIPSRQLSTQIQATLVEGEAMLSFYFGRDASFVWAVPKDGPVAFAEIKATGGEIQSKVRRLREALEPQAAMISDIPAFDVKLATSSIRCCSSRSKPAGRIRRA